MAYKYQGKRTHNKHGARVSTIQTSKRKTAFTLNSLFLRPQSNKISNGLSGLQFLLNSCNSLKIRVIIKN